MRSFNDNYDDPDEFEDVAYARSQALDKLLRAHRREERMRHENRYRDYSKDRLHRDKWNWDNDDEDYDSYVDDTYDQYYEERYDS